jgi:hypothetical protein
MHAGTEFQLPGWILEIAGILKTTPAQKRRNSGNQKEFPERESRIAGMAAGMHNLVPLQVWPGG